MTDELAGLMAAIKRAGDRCAVGNPACENHAGLWSAVEAAARKLLVSRDAEIERLREALIAIDLSDDYVMNNADDDELIIVRRPKSVWVKARAALAEKEENAMSEQDVR